MPGGIQLQDLASMNKAVELPGRPDSSCSSFPAPKIDIHFANRWVAWMVDEFSGPLGALLLLWSDLPEIVTSTLRDTQQALYLRVRRPV